MTVSIFRTALKSQGSSVAVITKEIPIREGFKFSRN